MAVVTMPGAPVSHKVLLHQILERRDVEHLVVVIERKDGLHEIMYDRQQIAGIVFASTVLYADALRMASEALDGDATQDNSEKPDA